MKTLTTPLLFITLILTLFSNSGQCQDEKGLSFKQERILTLESNTNTKTTTIIVTVDKSLINSDKKIHIYPSQDKYESTIDLTKIQLPLENKFKIDSNVVENGISFTLNLPVDALQEKTLTINAEILDKDSKPVPKSLKQMIIIIKPVQNNVSNNKNFEFWVLTGTNFDLLNDVKPQELFIRINTIFKIAEWKETKETKKAKDKSLFGQIAFYRNRYYAVDTASTGLPFSSVKRPLIGSNLYTITQGTYRRTTIQTIDPVACQFDLMYNINTFQEHNYFLTLGMLVSTSNVNIRYKYDYLDTTFFARTSRPDTIKGYGGLGTTFLPEKISYRTSSGNINLGLLWIYDTNTINIKTHLTTGISSFSKLISYSETRGAGSVYRFDNYIEPYAQMRMFATQKSIGISLGAEAFIRKNEVTAFNFTLSKTFDATQLGSIFSPISSLKPSTN
ncbi:hypothetical protein EJV47_01595 [Hymenobacter gummosus]|uniref:DUF4861 domain-containing protein n=1 Tax=Hymenobacter gummosus TaxID=1776032 RepID=A0A431U8A4_9BACT|nr:hypothetical protein [Hymenobacter gummosus]RTQ53459.1 hypothetical protein EJV47_01595 [Hymenobacter gummosus]